MKKFLLTLLMMIFISPTCLALKNVYEPESDTAASFSSYSVENGNVEMTFVKYATLNNQDDEYWLRLGIRRPNNKVLYYATLTIDNTEYSLKSVEDLPYKYISAAESVGDNMPSASSNYVARTKYRYFTLSSDIAEKIKSAKTISLKYHVLSSINNRFNISDNFLKNIQQTYSLEYSEIGRLWNPKDRK